MNPTFCSMFIRRILQLYWDCRVRHHQFHGYLSELWFAVIFDCYQLLDYSLSISQEFSVRINHCIHSTECLLFSFVAKNVIIVWSVNTSASSFETIFMSITSVCLQCLQSLNYFRESVNYISVPISSKCFHQIFFVGYTKNVF